MNIANEFAGIYSKMYNQDPLSESLCSLKDKISDKINEENFQAEEINEALISKVLKLLKPKKRDSLFDVTSDMYINGPSELIVYLTCMIKAMVVHGSVPTTVLLCILTPLVKNSLDDMTVSSNYRAIAGGCLILKLIDLVILELEGGKLNSDALQFAY